MLPDDREHIAATPHLQEAYEIKLAIARRQTAAQKIANILSLRQTAWDLKWAVIRRENPTLADAEVQERVRQLFLHGQH